MTLKEVDIRMSKDLCPVSQLNDKFLDCLTFLLFSQIAKICSLNACQHFDVMPRVGPGSRNLSSVHLHATCLSAGARAFS